MKVNIILQRHQYASEVIDVWDEDSAQRIAETWTNNPRWSPPGGWETDDVKVVSVRQAPAPPEGPRVA